MNISSTLAGLSLVVASACLALPPPQLYASDEKARATQPNPPSSEPVIQHEYRSQINILLLISALEVEGKTLKSLEEAERFFRATEKSIAEINDDGPNQAQAANLTRDAARLLHFYLSQVIPPEEEDRVAQSAKWLESFSQKMADSTKKPELKARAAYFNALAKFLLSDGGDGLASLVQLRPALAGDKLVAANVDMLLGYSLALSPGTAAQGYSYMAQATQFVSVQGRVAQKLVEAYVESGLDADGSPSLAAKPSAASKLSYALQIARGMPPTLQYLISDTAIYIWTHSKAGKDARPPQFLSDGFKGVIPVEALREREALSFIKAQNFSSASALYKQMIPSIKQNSLVVAIERRIWELDLAQFQRTGQIASLEASYQAFKAKYATKKKGQSSDLTALMQSITEAYRDTLDRLLTQSLQPQTPAASKTATMQASVRYLQQESDRQIAYPLKLKLAQLYRSLNLYKEAVDTYLDLAKDQPLKNFMLAIEAQSQLAKWPTQPSFDAAAPGPQDERAKLLGIFDKVYRLKGGDEWFIIAHIGLLQRALKQEKKAEELWLAHLQKNLNGKLAFETGGLLLTEFYAGKLWQDYIDLAHLFMQKKANPTSKYKPFAYQPWLADALYFGGTSDLQSKKFARAVSHFEEFAKGFATDPRVPNALFSSAYAYKGLGKLTPALLACRNIVERHPQFNQKSKVMLQAAEWATADRNAWEFAFFFYTKYLQDFKNESNIPQVRTTLADLYYKRKLYGWASRLYKEQSLAPQVPKEGQLQAALLYLEIEEKFGEPKDAYWGALRIAQLVSAPHPAYLRSLAFQGRYIAGSKDLQAMADMESKLMPFGKNSKEILEALGLLRFRRAEQLTQAIVYTENNLGIRDPEAVVKKYFDRYEAEKQHYLKVCQLGITALCAPAFYRLTTVAQQGYEAVQKVEIADTLGPNRVNSFKVFKQLHLSKIEQNHKGFTEQALKLSKQGTTTPIWRDEIAKSLEFEGSTKLAH